MALALKEQFQIQIVPAYQAADGKRFHDAAEAQGYTRNAMLDSVITAATKERPEFAKLDPVLLRDFLLRTGKHVGAIMNEPLEPKTNEALEADRLRNTSQIVIKAGDLSPEDEARLKTALERRPREHPEVPMHVAVAEAQEAARREDPSTANRAALHRELEASSRPRWDKHPLDGNGLKSAMAAVDQSEDRDGSLKGLEKAVEADIQRALSIGNA